MKTNKLFILLTMVGLIASLSANARTIRISNIQGDQADYTSIDAAIPFIQDGDTLQVAGSFFDYSSTTITISKRVVMIGAGFYLHENAPVQATEAMATLDQPLVFDGSSSGSIVVGMKLKSLSLKVNDFTLKNCLIENGVNTTVTINTDMQNLTIEGCFMRGRIFGATSNTLANLTLKNNIMVPPLINKLTAGTMTHNTVFATKTDWKTSMTLQNTVIKNNIFLNIATSTGTSVIKGAGNTIDYNSFIVSSGDLMTTTDAANNTVGTNNVFNTFHRTLFVKEITSASDFQAGTSTSTWGFDLKLASSSAAKGVGEGGVDLGAFGGSTPYTLAGMVVPHISELDIDPAGSKTRKIPVKLKAEAKNFSNTGTKVSRIEYFIDTDPGRGSATAFSFTSASTVDLDTEIDLASVAEGVHTLYIRLVDDKGLWSTLYSRPFYNLPKLHEQPATTTITAAEYFIDTDPGAGNGKSITISATGTEITQDFEIDTTNLDRSKTHQLYVRMQDNTGRWSATQVLDFKVDNSAVTALSDLLPNGSKLRFFPNPTTEWLTVDFGMTPAKAATLKIRDTQGRILKTMVVQGVRSHKIKVIDLKPGLYFVELNDGAHSIVRKFVVR